VIIAEILDIISVVHSIGTSISAAQTRRINIETTKLSDMIILTISCDPPFAFGHFYATEGIDKASSLSDQRYTYFGSKYGLIIGELLLLAYGIVVIDKAGIIQYV
jgi:thiol peroxidase